MANAFSLNNSSSNQFWLYSLVGGLYTVGAGYLISKLGVAGAIVAIAVPIALAIVISILLEPRIGLLLYIQISFIVGFTRFVQVDVPVGLFVDGLLFLTLL